jgi:glycosyltransferase involved in cell wall biosynthesis
MKGGMDLHGKHLFEGLVQNGHEVLVVSTRHPSGKPFEEIDGIRLYYLRSTTFGSPRRGWKKESLKTFKEIWKREKIDLVVSQGKGGSGVARFAKKRGIPFVSILHGYETMIFFSILNQIINFKKGYRYLLKALVACFYYSIFHEWPLLIYSTKLIAVSENVLKVLERRPLVKHNKIAVIHYGINLENFKASNTQRRETRLALDLSQKDRVILFLSLISKQKGADIALKALKVMSEEEKSIKLILAGDGEYLDEAKRMAKQLGLEQKVVFPGFVRNEETAKLYNAADVFIFPTLRLESFGIVLAEAMACGKPVIASRIGSIPNVIEDGINGILIPPGNYKMLAAQIRRLFKNRDLFHELSTNAQQKATEDFGLDRMVKQIISEFESTVNQAS